MCSAHCFVPTNQLPSNAKLDLLATRVSLASAAVIADGTDFRRKSMYLIHKTPCCDVTNDAPPAPTDGVSICSEQFSRPQGEDAPGTDAARLQMT